MEADLDWRCVLLFGKLYSRDGGGLASELAELESLVRDFTTRVNGAANLFVGNSQDAEFEAFIDRVKAPIGI